MPDLLTIVLLLVGWVAVALVLGLVYSVIARRIRHSRANQLDEGPLPSRSERRVLPDRRVGLPDSRAVRVDRRVGPQDRRRGQAATA